MMEEQKDLNDIEKESEIRRENLNAGVFILESDNNKIKKESCRNQSADLEFSNKEKEVIKENGKYKNRK